MVVKENRVKKYTTKPIICRIKGRNAEIANSILEEMNADRIITELDFQTTSEKVIEMAQRER